MRRIEPHKAIGEKTAGAPGRFALGVLLLAGLAMQSSCGQGSRQARIEADAQPVTTGLDALTSGRGSTPRVATPDPNAEVPASSSIESLAQQSAFNLEQALANQSASAQSAQAPGASASRAPDEGAVSTGLVNVQRTSSATGTAPGSADQALAASGSPGAAQETPLLPDDRIRVMATELAALLSSRARNATTPAGDVALAMALSRVSGNPLATSVTLDPQEQAVIDAITTLHTSLASESTLDAADTLQMASDKAAVGLPLRITDAALCTRVRGFGDYAALSTNAFLAGRTNKVIVYVQVDRFGSRTGTGGTHSVELSQELNIYHDSDGAHCWKRPAESVIESSKTKRRDFYLVNEISLPSNLSVGKYRMKVTMRDAVGGSMAEATIPFSIVADSKLAHTPE